MYDIKVLLTKHEVEPNDPEPNDPEPNNPEPNNPEPDVIVPNTGAITFLSADGQNTYDGRQDSDGFFSGNVAVGILLILLAFGVILALARHRNHKKFFVSNNKSLHITPKYRSLIGTLVVTVVFFTIILPVIKNKNSEELVLATDNILTIKANPVSISAELKKDSAITVVPSDVVVESATQAGYVLSLYADDADLVINGKENSTKIAGLKGGSNASLLTTNTWGIATTRPTDNQSKVWYAVPVGQGTAITIKSTDAATDANDKTTVYYGVNVNDLLEAGEYSGTINYVAVANVISEQKIYMQDFTVDQCEAQASDQPITVYDRRDESDYTVRYINDACWMTQNLRITKSIGQPDWTISKTDSNFDNVDTWNIRVDDIGGAGTFNEARSHVPSDSDTDYYGNNVISEGIYTLDEIGVWYNFCAVSANNSNGCKEGEYVANTGNVTGDICPAGWHLPTYIKAPGSFADIYGPVSSNGTNYASAFSPIYSGVYTETMDQKKIVQSYGDEGYWWSADAATLYDDGQFIMEYSKNELETVNNNTKSAGYTVRCVRTDNKPATQTAYIIALEPNGADPSVKMRWYTAVINQTFELPRTTYEKSGYTFDGWNTVADGSGTWYGQGGTEPINITLTSLPADNKITLYAQWRQGENPPDEKKYMQEMSISDCPTNGASVYDKRDEQVYTVAKIGDSCWMTKNLNLAGGTPLYSDTSNVPSGYDSSNGNPYFTLPAGVTDAGGDNDFSYDETAYVSNNTGESCGNDSPCYSYYSWVAATAGNLTNISNDGESAPYSICPHGWHLPSTSEQAVADNSDFRNLMVGLGGDSATFIYYEQTEPTGYEISNKMSSSPNNFVKGGFYCRVKDSDGILAASCPIRGSLAGGGGTGSYWSSTRAAAAGAYALFYNSSTVNSAYTPLARSGLSVRCVMDN